VVSVGAVRAVAPTVDEVWAALAEVPDPEIPAISVVDLGVVHRVTVEGPRIRVALLPTFVGCPALDVMRDAVRQRLQDFAPGADVAVAFTFADPWTSDRITPVGREHLRQSGFTPPLRGGPQLLQVMPRATCPYCGSRQTQLENAFGPTLCRNLHYCADCRQPFEAFKAV
jgi:ring-1,2-phenylacetyl-CoA epoxidase subunit PaaD